MNEVNIQKADGAAIEAVALSKGTSTIESADAEGYYVVECVGPREEARAEYCALRDKAEVLKAKERSAFAKLVNWFKGTSVSRELELTLAIMQGMLEPKWNDEIHNVVCTEGKNAGFQAMFKASGFTATVYMGLIGNTTYSAPVAGNTAAAIATSSSGNSWNECVAGTCAARAAPSFATPSAGAVSLSAARTFSMLATDTINGCFVLITSVALAAPTSAVANTSGAIWSAGAFTGGAKAVGNGDTLNVSYTASM